jgi:hypothetical protein
MPAIPDSIRDFLANVYIDRGARFLQRDFPDGFVIHVEVARFYGVGSWMDPEES